MGTLDEEVWDDDYPDDGECHCFAHSVSECACGNYPYMEVLRPERQWDVTLGTNFESAASMAAMHRIGYTRGFEAGRLLAEFCEDYEPEPYFPLADTRPTAERLAWRTP